MIKLSVFLNDSLSSTFRHFFIVYTNTSISWIRIIWCIENEKFHDISIEIIIDSDSTWQPLLLCWLLKSTLENEKTWNEKFEQKIIKIFKHVHLEMVWKLLLFLTKYCIYFPVPSTSKYSTFIFLLVHFSSFIFRQLSINQKNTVISDYNWNLLCFIHTKMNVGRILRFDIRW